MNNPINTPAKTQQQVTNATEGTTNQVTIQQHQADNPKTKNIDTHQCITIRWSLDSVCRRSADAAHGQASVGRATVARVPGGAS
ncbi:hypothetical protein [Kribbella sp.]|uniref:hypothetical protein n=1 Tax=Kribbella sp. TaxID=1871183 RepID=UPI002D7A36DC|nr:hypothetical protein [Kribbella sp.]